MFPLLTRFAAPCTAGAFQFLNFPPWYKYLECETIEGKPSPIFDLSNDPGVLGRVVLAVVELLLRVGGLVAVGFIIYGGIQYILSQGDPQKAASARRSIINALVGLVVAALSTAIVQLVGRSLIV